MPMYLNPSKQMVSTSTQMIPGTVLRYKKNGISICAALYY